MKLLMTKTFLRLPPNAWKGNHEMLIILAARVSLQMRNDLNSVFLMGLSFITIKLIQIKFNQISDNI